MRPQRLVHDGERAGGQRVLAGQGGQQHMVAGPQAAPMPQRGRDGDRVPGWYLDRAVRVAAGRDDAGIGGQGQPVTGPPVQHLGDGLAYQSAGGIDHFAAYNGTALVEVSSGNRVVYRLSLRGDRRMNHAIHMAAVTQIRYQHTKGRAYYDKKVAEGKTAKEALRALKRQVNDAIYRRMKADARRAAASMAGPGGHPGNDSEASAAGLHPEHRLFGQATPGPAPTLRPPPARSKAPRPGSSRRTRRPAAAQARPGGAGLLPVRGAVTVVILAGWRLGGFLAGFTRWGRCSPGGGAEG